jgi:hypothetical protein
MKCPYCIKEFHDEDFGNWVFEYDEHPSLNKTGYEIAYTFCPACSKLIVVMREGFYNSEKGEYDTIKREWLTKECNEQLLYPKGYCRLVEKEVPEKYATDYREASDVKTISAKASAAISRRLLQVLLREECKVKKSTLAKEIQEFLEQPGIPSYLVDAIDAVRNVGNFAAHPLKDTNTGEIVDVEDGEAEWLLDVLDSMFDYLFVQPRKLKERKDKLNEKLKNIGKPPMN